MNHLKNCVIALSIIFYSLSASAQYTEQDIYIYIDTYKELAINKMYEYKIPASITIAQGIFESACGKSHLAVDGNNHFGIKCHKDWTGDTILIDDDELQECFRKYEKVEDSYTDHSLFLKNRQRYANLFTLDIMDYPGWARGLKAAGYATNPQYADRLISLIDRFHLAMLDTIYQYRLQNGYFEHYPDVHPEEMAGFSYVQCFGQPDTNGLQPVERPATRIPSEPDLHPATITKTPSHSSKIRIKPTHRKVPDKKPTPTSGPSSSQPSKAASEPKPAAQQSNNSSSAKPTQPAAPKTETPAVPTSQPTPTPTPASTPAHATAPAPTASPTPETVFTATKGQFTPYSGYPFTEREVYVNNNTLFIIAEEGDTYAKIARDVQLPEKKIKKFNDITGAAKPHTGEVVYIEKKANSGTTPTYTVQDQESLRYIAQKSGVRLKKLCDFNGIATPDTPLKKGRIIKLK